mmetsp:Transcript_36647/g.104978  ORF Transcript_36647/g.104978 Transcript_36647/m.104978 type:complete len:260 (+) Transcript_36647:510-1289(+)
MKLARAIDPDKANELRDVISELLQKRDEQLIEQLLQKFVQVLDERDKELPKFLQERSEQLLQVLKWQDQERDSLLRKQVAAERAYWDGKVTHMLSRHGFPVDTVRCARVGVRLKCAVRVLIRGAGLHPTSRLLGSFWESCSLCWVLGDWVCGLMYAESIWLYSHRIIRRKTPTDTDTGELMSSVSMKALPSIHPSIHTLHTTGQPAGEVRDHTYLFHTSRHDSDDTQPIHNREIIAAQTRPDPAAPLICSHSLSRNRKE